MITKFKQIGYWKTYKEESSDLPWPTEGRISDEIRQKCVDFLLNGKYREAWMGMSRCRICGKNNGSSDLSHDEFYYPEGYVHYIRDHNIMPDIDLLTKIISKDKNENFKK